MIKSMTGFGRSDYQSEDCRITVEMKAVNHRYCDINLKLPRMLNDLEADIRAALKQKISRGKVDVYITFEDLSGRTTSVRLDEDLSREYYQALEKISEQHGIPNTVTAWQIGRMQDVLCLQDVPINQDHVKEELMTAVGEALSRFVESRIKEGEVLKEDILSKLGELREAITVIEERYPEVVRAYRSKLEEKVRALLEDGTIDDNRIAAEVVLYADKICVDEETVRLRSHVENMRDVLREGGAVGRKLDFIAQEMNREANTILSKANDIDTSNRAIDLKTGIEKIREQVQNIE